MLGDGTEGALGIGQIQASEEEGERMKVDVF
jgi:hypothetical protein